MSADREAAIRHELRQGGIVSQDDMSWLLAELAAAREEIRRYRASIVAHHNIAHLSDEAIAEGFGAPGGCPICAEAQAALSEGEG